VSRYARTRYSSSEPSPPMNSTRWASLAGSEPGDTIEERPEHREPTIVERVDSVSWRARKTPSYWSYAGPPQTTRPDLLPCWLEASRDTRRGETGFRMDPPIADAISESLGTRLNFA
jgi:hypothetical protein